jgi:hypothetical protein
MGYKNSGELHIKSSAPTQLPASEVNLESFSIVFQGEKFANKDFMGKSGMNLVVSSVCVCV